MADFILQAVTRSSHGDLLKEFLGKAATQTATISTAFLTRGGVGMLESELKGLGEKATVYVGIRNGITTAEGLLALLGLSVNLFVIDTGATSPIFHPKIYLRLGKSTAELLVGSANLTSSGLYTNIEGSLLHRLDLSVKQQSDLAEQVQNALSKMAEEYPEHVFQITKAEDVDALLSSGRVVSEEALKESMVREGGGTRHDKSERRVARMKLKTSAPRSRRTAARRRPDSAPIPVTASGKVIPPDEDELELLWSSGPLKRRDLSIPAGKNTSLTGSMLLKKGESDIDQQTYFKEVVFKDFGWSDDDRTKGKKIARIPFQLVVDGTDYGTRVLTVTHDTRTDTASYKQRQPMSAIRWGEARALVSNEAYLNKTMRLYKDPDDQTQFILTIN